MKTLLFTGGGGAATEALDRLLRDRYVVHFCDADPDAKPPSIRPERWHVIPRAVNSYGGVHPDFVSSLYELCIDLKVDLLIPGVDEELRPLSFKPNNMPCRLLLPAYTYVSARLDKFVTSRFLALHNIPAPVTERLWPNKGGMQWPAFPCILKPREERGSKHVYTVKSETEGGAAVILSGLNPGEFITQAYVPGQEYTVTLVANQAKQLRAIVPVRVDLKRGITLRAETDDNPEVIETCRRIHAADPFAGVVNVQGILTTSIVPTPDEPSVSTRFTVFEINPRVSTTTCLAMAAGVDVIGLACESFGEGLVPWNRMTLRRSWQTSFGEVWEPSCVS
jgi:carbamoyl-phosphate synthase large subunit